MTASRLGLLLCLAVAAVVVGRVVQAPPAELTIVTPGAGNEGPPPVPEGSGAAIGMTLFPPPVLPGDSVRYLVAGSVLDSPAAGAQVVTPFRRGAVAIAAGEVESLGRRWVAVSGGFVPAALVDLIPAPVEGILPAGREGLVAGRVLPWDYAPDDLDTVPASLLYDGWGRVILLRRPALRAFTEMAAAAAAAGAQLAIVSGYRSASYQADLFARQIERRGPFQDVSAPPGRSEHQLGTTVDVTSPGSAPLEIEFGETAAGRWIADHAGEWGFVISFSRERHLARRVSYEPWHIRWVAANRDEAAW